ncbi:MAG: head-tail adaptor protein [Gammaproteobacteria bacterium]|nr:head-tail adaptor protein [Gammaproteobacteria bacterium]
MTLTDWELTGMRSAINELLPGTCVILTGTLTANGAGEFTTAWGTTSTIACRLDPIKGYEQQSGGAISAYQRYRLTLPWDAALTSGARVRISGVDYNVLGVTPSDNWKLDTRAEVEKI